MFKWIIAIFLLALVGGIVGGICQIIFDNKTAKRQKITECHIIKKFSAPEKYFVDSAFCKDGAGIFKALRAYGVWKKDSCLCFLNTVDINSDNENYYEISVDDIVYYRCYGDEHYYSEVSGGGGGGSSLGGAVVGGILGGATGAVIGSRKKQNSVETTVRHIDDKETYLVVNVNGEERTVVFAGDEMYKNLMKLIPHKVYESVNNTVLASKDKACADSEYIVQRFEMLKNLLDNDMISDDEYEEKKKELLSKI